MDILKGSQGGQAEVVTASDLALIHQQSRKELTAEEVYTFSVRLCDTELDRDFDRFPKKTLEELAVLFVGKSGIFDHNWTAQGQACRIFRTEVVQESLEDPLGTGEGTYYLKGYAYMVRTERNRDLILEIEAGIKREVSVGCAVAATVCSICGEDVQLCPHTKGEFYEGRRCYGSLEQGTDAYEFSFVAVPAQPKSGVMKSKGNSMLMEMIQSLLDSDSSYQEAMGRGETHWSSKGVDPMNMPSMEELALLKEKVTVMKAQAEVGRACLMELQGEVKRLGALAEEAFSEAMLDDLVKKLNLSELQAMKSVFQSKVEKKLPIQTQLDYGMGEDSVPDGAFMI